MKFAMVLMLLLACGFSPVAVGMERRLRTSTDVVVRSATTADRDAIINFIMINSQKGTTYRRKVNREWLDEKNNVLEPSKLLEEKVAIPELIGEIDEVVRRFDTFKFGLQIGSIYKNFAFRFGFFENTAGCAIDVEMPVKSDNFRWISTFEAFDLKGWDRINDSRPHLKWINRLFFLRNFFLVVGADDFISKHNRSAFMGGGVRFCDDDFQYFAESMGLS